MDVQKLREDFPALSVNRGGGPPIYFDSACVTLRPRQVIDKVIEYYEQYPGCHGRTTHYFGRRTTEEYVTARKKVQRYIGARKPEEVVFTKNTTEGINIVARGVSFRPGEEILSSEMEHTSNLTPWQIVSAEKGVKRRFFPYRKDLTFDMPSMKRSGWSMCITSRTSRGWSIPSVRFARWHMITALSWLWTERRPQATRR